MCLCMCEVIPCEAHQNPLSEIEQVPQSFTTETCTLQPGIGSMTECFSSPSAGTILGQQ